MPLTDDAKKELQEAIRIVREDRFEQFVRSTHTPKVSETDKKDELEKNGATPPPGKENEKESANEPRRSAYWGELMSD